MGATTIWERWDSMLPDGTLNPGEMTSFNHYALGAVAAWMHRTIAGLAPAEPGYRRLLIRPRPGGGLTHAHATLDTPYGRAEAGWERTGDHLKLVVVVPPNTTATVYLPTARTPPSKWARAGTSSRRRRRGGRSGKERQMRQFPLDDIEIRDEFVR